MNINTNFTNHYENWRKTRIACLIKYFDIRLLEGKTLLELGCGHADIGIYFRDNYKCNLIASDAREEHLAEIKKRDSTVQTLQFDCDKNTLSQKYDVILHWGVLYHIMNIEGHLKNVCENCDYLLLESEVIDSTDENEIIFKYEDDAYDQAFNRTGCRPSPAYIERLLRENGFSFKLITDPILDSDTHKYSWPHTESKISKDGLRRYWIAWNNATTSRPV